MILIKKCFKCTICYIKNNCKDEFYQYWLFFFLFAHPSTKSQCTPAADSKSSGLQDFCRAYERYKSTNTQLPSNCFLIKQKRSWWLPSAIYHKLLSLHSSTWLPQWKPKSPSIFWKHHVSALYTFWSFSAQFECSRNVK